MCYRRISLNELSGGRDKSGPYEWFNMPHHPYKKLYKTLTVAAIGGNFAFDGAIRDE